MSAWDSTLSLAGLGVGLVVGLTGMGGGALMTPVLIFFFGVPPLAAVSSDIVSSFVMKPLGGLVHIRRGTVHWRLVQWLCVGSVPGAFTGVLLLRLLGNANDLTTTVRTALGIALLMTAGALAARSLLLRRHAGKSVAGVVDPDADSKLPVRPALTVTLGAAAGILVGMTSVGAGSLVGVCLLLTYPTLRATTIVGTDLVQAVPLVASASLGHILFGDLNLGLTGAVVLGGVPGVWIGARVSARAPNGAVRAALAVVMLASGTALLGGPPWLVASVAGSATAVAVAVAGTRLSSRRRRNRLNQLPVNIVLSRIQLDEVEQAALARELFGLELAQPAWPRSAELTDIEGVVLATTDGRGNVATDRGIAGSGGGLRWPSPAYVRSQIRERGWERPYGYLGWPPEQPPDLERGLLVLLASAGMRPDDAELAACAKAWRTLVKEEAALYLVAAPVGVDVEREQARRILDTYGAECVNVPLIQPLVRKSIGSGVAVLLTGLSGAGKSTIATRVVEGLVERGRTVTLLDGDEVRAHLSAGLGFSAADRDTNVRRIGWVAAQVVKHGGIAVCAPIAPSDAIRSEVRVLIERQGGPGSFILVYVATPLAECERRDRKGLYARARRGEIPQFTGISALYEEPRDAELVLNTTGQTVDQVAGRVLSAVLTAESGA